MLPVTNSLTEPAILPERFVAALFEMEGCPKLVAALGSSSRDTSSALEEIAPLDLSQMISETLTVPERQQLLSLLH